MTKYTISESRLKELVVEEVKSVDYPFDRYDMTLQLW